MTNLPNDIFRCQAIGGCDQKDTCARHQQIERDKGLRIMWVPYMPIFRLPNKDYCNYYIEDK